MFCNACRSDMAIILYNYNRSKESLVNYKYDIQTNQIQLYFLLT